MSASKRVLVIGVGSIGERHVRCFQDTGQAAVSIVETNAQLRADIAGRYRVDAAFESLAAALDASFDAAVICTPADVHVPMAIECARRGMHLLIEKPLSIDRARVDELAAVVRENRLVVGIAYVLRCHPALTAMRAAIQSGRFGSPVQIVATSGQHFPTYRPAYREIYYASHATGGGAVQDALTHVINASEWLVGPITSLAADSAHQVLPGVSVEDTVHVVARHGTVLGCYSLNQHQAPNEFTLTVICERGTARFEYHQHRYRWMTEAGGEWQDESVRPLERDTLFICQAARFLEATNGDAPLCSLGEGEQTLRVNLAILAACRSKTWVDL